MSKGMRLRMELFVEDMDRTVDFYRDVLGFELARREEGYASVRRGDVILGIGPIAKLPAEGGYFTERRLAQDRGLGVEIVLEVEDVAAEYEQVVATGWPIVEELQGRPWGLTDFRITDPDGYYLRVTDMTTDGDAR
ncbi:MAG TPA: VOC family protein [Thermomicrobiales bacterium]|nr:VOC family protein [Thermomicrobiales bacterium]